jgi:arylsulfatase A-like enzyme
MFLYLAFQGCHSGDNSFVQAPPDLVARFKKISPAETCGSWQRPQTGDCTLRAMRKSVAAAAASVDDAVGGVVGSLKRARMYDNSLIVLSTDNGTLRSRLSRPPARGRAAC